MKGAPSAAMVGLSAIRGLGRPAPSRAKGRGSMSEELAVTTATFEAEVVKSAIPVVADFWAEWCGPCRMIAPVLKELARDYKDRLKVAKINVDEEPDLASRYGIQSIPTLLFFKGGEMVRQQIGAVPRAVLEKIVKELV
jgi:thioredoxin 1